ncbi:hypothetical protein ACFLYU_04200, partial [Candidatus Dependentiae bacterium]
LILFFKGFLSYLNPSTCDDDDFDNFDFKEYVKKKKESNIMQYARDLAKKVKFKLLCREANIGKNILVKKKGLKSAFKYIWKDKHQKKKLAKKKKRVAFKEDEIRLKILEKISQHKCKQEKEDEFEKLSPESPLSPGSQTSPLGFVFLNK